MPQDARAAMEYHNADDLLARIPPAPAPHGGFDA